MGGGEMTPIALVRKGLVVTPLTGKYAVICAIAAVALPTLYRTSLDGMVMGIGYCPYLPAVLLSAVLLGWRRAAVIAVISALVIDALFVGKSYRVFDGPTAVFGDIQFLVAAAAIIGFAHAMRTAFADLIAPTGTGSVIFSVKDGQAWASWPTTGYTLRLGPQDDVAEIMKDYLAQLECGKQLIARHSKS
jgi:hypothetical protein